MMPRDDGKTALTRVVQRHLDSSSPHRSPKRNKNTPPVKRSDNKEIGSLKSEKFNSFRRSVYVIRSSFLATFRGLVFCNTVQFSSYV